MHLCNAEHGMKSPYAKEISSFNGQKTTTNRLCWGICWSLDPSNSIQWPCGQAPPPCLGQWGQTADQQTTNKPENQQSNEPTDQQANKATNKKHTKQQERLTQSWPKNWLKVAPKFNPKSNKIQLKINQKSTKIGLLGALGGSWGALGGLLGGSGHQEPKYVQKIDQKSNKNQAKI